MWLTFNLSSAMSHSPKLEALKVADFAYFGATWWPRARYERLKIVTFLATWVGILLRPVRELKLKQLYDLAVRLGRRYVADS